MAHDSQPQQNDLVLGGHLPPPASGAILGGIQGLHQRLEVASPDQKVELLSQSLNYAEAGIDLLVEAVHDAALIVRATACQLLQKIDSPKAQQAIADGLLLNPGDRLYPVYESVISYNDWCYDLLQTYEDIEDYSYGLTLVSQHIHRSSAEIAAQLHHQWRSIQVDECDYLPQIGWDEIGGIRNNFDLVNWCKTHQILIRLPRECQADFEQRLNHAGYAIEQTSRLFKEHELILQEIAREKFEEREHTAHNLGIQKPWDLLLRRTLEGRAIQLLQASQQYELLGQLWLEAAGRLAFVHEEIVTAPTYVKVVENLWYYCTMNTNPHPESTDAVIGGQTPPPTCGVVLGGIEGLQQRFTGGNPEQRVEALADALNYGEVGVDFLLDAVNDAVLDVRVAAYQHLQKVVSERTNQENAEGVPQWWQQLATTLIPERIQRTITKGIPLKKGDRLYRVYISAIDYDDSYYTLLDSVQAYEAHDFCYDGELLHPVERYLFRDQAEQIAQDLHRTILSNGNFAEFNQRHQLQLKPSDYYLFKITGDLRDFYRSGNQSIRDWCMAHSIDIDLSDYVDEEMPEDDEQGEYWWEAQEEVLEQLQDQKNYSLLEEFCNLIGMGRFTFVHEESVDRDGYFPVTGTLTARA